MIPLVLAVLLGLSIPGRAQTALDAPFLETRRLMMRRPSFALSLKPHEWISSRTIRFSDHAWLVKTHREALGPGPNLFSDSDQNVWVDEQGRLHMKITYRNGAWRCSEVILARALGYGTYRFVVDSKVDDLDPNAVLGLFTWDDDPAESNREIDIELSRWGGRSNKNAQYVVPSGAGAGTISRFEQSGETHTHAFSWSPRSVSFESFRADGSASGGWTAREGIPTPGQARVHINLWLVSGNPPAEGREIEVVIRSFVFHRVNLLPLMR